MAPLTTIHRDARDVALEHLALDEAVLRERVADLERDVITYRALLCDALAVAHKLHIERDDYEQKYYTSLDDGRQLRATLKTLRSRLADTERDLQTCRRGRAA